MNDIFKMEGKPTSSLASKARSQVVGDLKHPTVDVLCNTMPTTGKLRRALPRLPWSSNTWLCHIPAFNATLLTCCGECKLQRNCCHCAHSCCEDSSHKTELGADLLSRGMRNQKTRKLPLFLPGRLAYMFSELNKSSHCAVLTGLSF